MPREIKFRGKRIDNGEWVYGYYVKDDEGSGGVRHIIQAPDRYYEVNPETVGQYTGLEDKSSTEIYEGDIVKWGHLGGWYSENPVRVAIVKINPDIQFDCINLHSVFEYGCFAYKDTQNALEIIGNIHDNPELVNEHGRA